MYTIFFLFSLLPLRILYIISDVVTWLAHKVVRYRVDVVRSNLKSSFPEKSDKELKEIEDGFYSFLGDYFVETVKMTTMSRKEMMRRFKVENIEEFNESIRSGHSCSIFLAHYCNWEWVSSLALHIDPKAICAQVYHPLENRNADKAFLKIRSRWGGRNLSMQESPRSIIEWDREGVVWACGFISDQGPQRRNVVVLKFLNHTTAFFTGGQKLSARSDAHAYYLEMSRPRRGYYVGRFVRIEDGAADHDFTALTVAYARMLEKTIRRDPRFWLWSHRRWKRKFDDRLRIDLP